MKNFRLPAAVAAVALGVSTAVIAAAPATAADNYFVDTDLGAEASAYPGYPDDQWFTGNPPPATAPTTTDAGLELTGQTQLLYGAAEAPLTGASLLDLVENASVEASGVWSFQIAFFLDGDGASSTGFATLRPADFNTLDGDWVSSQDLPGLTANTPYALSDFADLIDFYLQLDEPANPVLLAHGIFVPEGSTTTVESITWSGDTSFFTAEVEDVPEPEVTPTPDTTPTPEPTEDADAPAPPATAVNAAADFTG